eukprot:TRINITY_DN2792_c0_g2_i1.p1 TRINITY_DN2792_c0_g2~~TRINITY_DN2792_c0_g2_i1.p1  ORF type:complete len:419 (+),score=47.51 TRINITY_DN2792_c0_g2_i1:37-1293(+)
MVRKRSWGQRHLLAFALLAAVVLWIGSHSLLSGAAHRAVRHGEPQNPTHQSAPHVGRRKGSGPVSSRRTATQLSNAPDRQIWPSEPWKNRRKYTLKDAGPRVKVPQHNVGIVTYIGNDKYVDGGLVMGYTAGKTSSCGPGEWCRTGVLISRKLDDVNVRRFQRVFDDVIAVNNSLATSVKKTPWGTTFDKLHLWGIIRYDVLVFYDADMILTRSTADYLDRVLLPTDPYWLGALTGQKGYFASGTMVLRPSASIHDELISFYQTVRQNKTDKWGFRGINARDGLVLRYFIAGRVVGIPSIPGYHASGSWKPWYNLNGDHSEVKNLAAFLRGEPQSNRKGAAAHFWEAYEEMHKELFQDDPPESAAWDAKWQGEYTPHTHLWLLRGTKWEYTQRIGEWRKDPRGKSDNAHGKDRALDDD